MGNKLEHEKIPKLLTSLAIPAICAQVVTLLYNMIDRMYIGRMDNGIMAMAGIGVCVPIISIITAFTGLFGRGGAPLAAIKMGENNTDEADNIISNSFMALIISSVIITILILLFNKEILILFGASKNSLPYALEYMKIYALGTAFVQLTVGMNFYINTQGFAKFGMMTIIIGGILNIILDPIFIFGFNMGTKGAALATVLSQFVSFLWVLSFLFGKRTLLRIRRKYLMFNRNIMKQIVTLGSAPFFMSSTEGLLIICFNSQLLKYGGDIAVSSMTIMISMFQFILLPIEGIAQGSQPIISFNYGAKNFDRVRKTIKLAIVVCLIYSFLGTVLMELFPKMFISIFTNDEILLNQAASMLRIYIFGCMIMGANSTFQQTYNSLGEGKRSFLFAFYRKIILLIPLIYVLPMLLPNKLMAVVLAEPISDLLTTVTNEMYFRRFIKVKLPTSSKSNDKAYGELIVDNAN